jgi:hypothetical protein
VGGKNAHPIVGHREHNFIAQEFKADIDCTGMRMADHVGQRLAQGSHRVISHGV